MLISKENNKALPSSTLETNQSGNHKSYISFLASFCLSDNSKQLEHTEKYEVLVPGSSYLYFTSHKFTHNSMELRTNTGCCGLSMTEC